MTTPLRQKLMEDLQLHGLSGRTQETYIREVQQLAEYYRKSPDQISEAELRAYFLYLLQRETSLTQYADGCAERDQVFLCVYLEATVDHV